MHGRDHTEQDRDAAPAVLGRVPDAAADRGAFARAEHTAFAFRRDGHLPRLAEQVVAIARALGFHAPSSSRRELDALEPECRVRFREQAPMPGSPQAARGQLVAASVHDDGLGLREQLL